ncbi:MAG TPA: hypothetical protein VFB27_08585 [Opitutaceae bacterium]|nr:hypothetical protein [Opitutaceae bacterium]
MSSSDKPMVYLLLGAAGSGRREVLADLIDGGLGADARPAVLLAADEPAGAPDKKFPGLARWTREDGIIAAPLPYDATHVFFVSDGRRDPIDQIESFATWLRAGGGQLARILCVVDCRLAEKNAALLPWYDACIHFADVVLLNHREGVANKWISEFERRYTGQFYPCLIEPVKAGRVKNPALILEPQALRMSHLFDEEQDWIFTDADGEEVDEEEAKEGDEEVEAAPEEDPYLVRDAAGRRAKRIPDIQKYLS